jgi:hypothetical protein
VGLSSASIVVRTIPSYTYSMVPANVNNGIDVLLIRDELIGLLYCSLLSCCAGRWLPVHRPNDLNKVVI